MARLPTLTTNNLADAVRRHQLQIFRFTTHVVDTVKTKLAKLGPDLLDLLLQADPTDVARFGDQLNRVTAVVSDARALTRRRFDAIGDDVAAQQLDLGREDFAFQVRSIKAETDQELAVQALPTREMRQVIDRALVDGAPSATWWRRQSQQLTRQFEDQLRRGLQQGEALGDLVKRIRGTRARNYEDGIMTTSKRNAEALVRTSTLSVTNALRMAQFQQNSDVIHGWQWLTTFDPRTCEICMALAGATFDLEGNPLPDSPYQGRPPTLHPPAHFNCRCTLISLVEDAPAANDLQFESWLNTLPETEQRDVLGPGRWQLWSDGKISVTDLIDGRGHPLTLDELRQQTKEAA